MGVSIAAGRGRSVSKHRHDGRLSAAAARQRISLGPGSVPGAGRRAALQSKPGQHPRRAGHDRQLRGGLQPGANRTGERNGLGIRATTSRHDNLPIAIATRFCPAPSRSNASPDNSTIRDRSSFSATWLRNVPCWMPTWPISRPRKTAGSQRPNWPACFKANSFPECNWEDDRPKIALSLLGAVGASSAIAAHLSGWHYICLSVATRPSLVVQGTT